jgi:enoyl-CoA hydratase/carnithine racemase
MAAVETESLLVADAEGVRTLTLNRPERRNALSLALMRDLSAALAATARDDDVRAVVLRGAGAMLSSGHDLNELVGCGQAEAGEIFAACSELMLRIHHLPQPVIAQAHGMATAAGCQLVCACDLAVASEECRFATPGVRIGLFCSTPMVELSRCVGRKAALELLLTGEAVDAATALRLGIVNRVVPREALDDEVRALAARVARYSPLTLRIGKEAFYRQLDLGLEEAYAHVEQVMAANAMAVDAQEGMRAFLEKREPRWTGR